MTKIVTRHAATLDKVEVGVEDVELTHDITDGTFTIHAQGLELAHGDEWFDEDGNHRISLARCSIGVDPALVVDLVRADGASTLVALLNDGGIIKLEEVDVPEEGETEAAAPFQAALDALSADYNKWLEREGLPNTSADELMMFHEDDLTQDQYDWVYDFCEIWEKVEALQNGTKPF